MIRPALLVALFAALLFVPTTYAEFPDQITIDGKQITCRTAAEIRAMGLECEDIPWKDNAARVLIEAMNAFPREDDRSDRDIDECVKKLDFGERADEVADYLGDHARAFELLRDADAMPKYQAPVAMSKRFVDIPLPALSAHRRLSRALWLKAAFEFSKGRRAAAVDDCMMTMRLGRRIADEPFLISGLVGLAVEGLALGDLHAMADSGRMTDAELAALAARLKGETPPDYAKSLRGERVFGLQTLEDIKRDPKMLEQLQNNAGGNGAGGWGTLLNRLTFNAEATKRNLTAFYDFLEANAKMPAHEALRPENSLDKYVADHRARWDRVTSALAPALGRARVMFARVETSIAALRIRVALERFRIAKKTYPKTLAELAPAFIDALPDDPFAGKPFCYRLEDDGGFTLWSVNDNLADDGGKDTPNSPGSGPDYVFTGRADKARP